MSSSPELRLVLLGNIGCGKTSSADTILGQLSHILPSASRTCQVRKGTSEGRTVTLVEAPRWYWNGGKIEESVRKETARAMSLLASGPHAFLLLVPVHQFTEVGCLCFHFLISNAVINVIFLVVLKVKDMLVYALFFYLSLLFPDGESCACRAERVVWGGGDGTHSGPADLWGLLDGKNRAGI